MSIDPHDWARESFRNHDRRAEAMESASIESANLALRSMLLLNGGASVALLGFLASIFNSDAEYADKLTALSPFLLALNKFAWGAGLAVLASALAYLTNSFYARALMAQPKKWDWPYIEANKASILNWRIGFIFNGVAAASGFGSIVMFIRGCAVVGFAV